MPVHVRKKGRVKKILRLLMPVMVIAVGMRYVWALASETDLFKLKEMNVEVEGNSMLSERDIIASLEIQYGKSIFSYRLREMEERLRKNRRIKEARIKRNFPDGLFIEIFEVIPAGYTFRQGYRCVVTAGGDVFPGPEGPPLKFIADDPQSIRTLSSFLQGLKEKSPAFYNKIIAADLNYRGDIILHTSKARMLWPPEGELTRTEIKRKISIYESLEKKEVSGIDFRFMDIGEKNATGSVIVKK